MGNALCYCRVRLAVPCRKHRIVRQIKFYRIFFHASLALNVLLQPGSASRALASESLCMKRTCIQPDSACYENPIIFSDYSDPDVIRVDDDFYLVSSSFNHVPGIPVLHSHDLLHWRIISHAVEVLPSPMYDRPQHGKGIWAPSIRYHNDCFWIYYGDPDLGLFMVKSKHPTGPWQAPVLVKEAKGWIDPCPLWDEDGQAYLVHAWAKSRVGFNSILTVNKMSPDGKKILDEGITVFDGHANHPTIEGPKFYKRNGRYYIFAPAGGVKTGWQTVLRSRSIFGPYEDKIVLKQGKSPINGPHQGGWVELANGESWFIHFQDRDAYGRIVHLQPMSWQQDWPVIGSDPDGDGIGEPVARFRPPQTRKASANYYIPTSDQFTAKKLAGGWQWHGNVQPSWYKINAGEGWLRLYALAPCTGYRNLWDLISILGQKFPGEQFEAVTHMSLRGLSEGDRAGLVVFGTDYSALTVVRVEYKYLLQKSICLEADQGNAEEILATVILSESDIFLKVIVDRQALCSFSYSLDDIQYQSIGTSFTAKPGKWVGARIGLFALAAEKILPGQGKVAAKSNRYADFKFIRFRDR